MVTSPPWYLAFFFVGWTQSKRMSPCLVHRFNFFHGTSWRGCTHVCIHMVYVHDTIEIKHTWTLLGSNTIKFFFLIFCQEKRIYDGIWVGICVCVCTCVSLCTEFRLLISLEFSFTNLCCETVCRSSYQG